jgi:hypothetical protein
MRQQIAAMLNGDAKAGSLRAQLVHGLLGSQVGDDSGLVGMTPLGAAFSASAANRDMRQGGSGAGHMLSAAAGMIPGAGPEAHAALEEVVPGVTRALQSIRNLHPEDIEALLGHGFKAGDIGDDSGLLFHHPETGESIEIDHKGQADHFDADGTRIASRPSLDSLLQMSEQGDTVPSTGIRAQLEEARKPNIVDAKEPPTVKGTAASLSNATKPGKVTPHSVDAGHITQVSGGDAKKQNFITQAMQDEGGNVPEEVANTLIDHATQQYATEDRALRALGVRGPQELAATHSIPEMLAMHYDLDPQTMGAAYDMPLAGSRSRQTQ